MTTSTNSKAHFNAIIPSLITVHLKANPDRYLIYRSFSHNGINFLCFVFIQHIKFPYQSDGCLKMFSRLPTIVSQARTDNGVVFLSN